MRISRKLRIAIAMNPKRAYQIAHEAGINPSALSRLLNGIDFPKPNDPRILRVGQIVGIPNSECFEMES